ncbi:hypothetical protein [Tellurirhabdus bombi]|uniref:hypothetical protein n=1 Tax=Tellurirhabdus bombi TaxID=2907205 RepID=UPI001F353FD0|nr:hypothetical protein [Tellurirhabdus bombi]
MLYIFTLVGPVLLFWGLSRRYYLKNRNQQKLQKAYFEALASGDKGRAWLMGRLYYYELRNGQITPQDEQNLEQDILTMKEVA